MKIYEFTEPELAFYKTFCNFTDAEEKLFDLRKKNVPLDRCAEIMGYENIKNLSRKVNNKIIKVANPEWMRSWVTNVYWKSMQA